MDDATTVVYRSYDEFWKAIDHREDPQVNVSAAETMAIPLAAAIFSGPTG